jgi:hypothetical protein
MRFFSWRCTIMLLLLMLLPLSGLLAVYHSSSELVRLRNAMVFHTITAAQASWTPDNPPAGFRQENTTVPPYLAVLLSEKTTGDNLSQLLHHATNTPDWAARFRQTPSVLCTVSVITVMAIVPILPRSPMRWPMP